MGQEQIGTIFNDNNNNQAQGGHLSNSRRKNIFTNTPVQSQVGSNRNSGYHRASQAEAQTPRSPVTPVQQYRQEEVKSQHRSGMQHSEVVSVALQNLVGDQFYEQMPPAEKYPTKLTYFNAWSLPIQKYYLEERGPYQGEPEEQVVEMRQPRQMKEFDAGELEGMMAERMKEELANTQRNKRRQNLNMV